MNILVSPVSLLTVVSFFLILFFLRLEYEQLLSEKVQENENSHTEYHCHIVYDDRRLRRQNVFHERLRCAEGRQIADQNVDCKTPGQPFILVFHFERHFAVGMIGKYAADNIRNAAGKPIVQMNKILQKCHHFTSQHRIHNAYDTKMNDLHNELFMMLI